MHPNEDGLPLDDLTAGTGDTPGLPPPLLSAGGMLSGLLEDLAGRHYTRQGGGWTGGLRCGLKLIDKALRGLRPGSITVLAAEPNVGKSTLANQIAYQVSALSGQLAASLYVSFEDDPSYLLLKHLARLSGWRLNDLLDGQVSPLDTKLRSAAKELECTPLFYLRGGAATTPDVLIERAAEVRDIIEQDALLLVIDYLQYFARFAGAKTTTDAVGMALTQLARIADKTGAALLVVGSQNREANKNGNPSMYGGRSSGEIEYDADALLVLSKDERTTMPGCGEARKLTAMKTRFGGAGTKMDLQFYPEHGYFQETE